MSFENRFKLKTNPFRMTPALSSEEIIWAGFPEIKKKFEDRIKQSIKIPSSGLILNWGEYGSGKTHAARYFSKNNVLSGISSKLSLPSPFSIVFTLPNGKNPVYDMFISIIDKIDIKIIRKKFKDLNVEEDLISFIDQTSDNLHIRSVLKAVFSEADEILIKKYLYGTLTNAELCELNNYGIIRWLSNDSDYIQVLAGLFSCLTYKKNVYSSIIIWIDEIENISLLNSTNIDKTNNFIRELLDGTPNNLLIFLNLTQSALLNVGDLAEYLSEAVTSRIKDRIQFDFPNEDEIKLYLHELLNNELYRTEEVQDKHYPFSKDVVNEIIVEFKNNSLRKYNEAFSMLLELADLDEISPITLEYYNNNKDDIIGWK